MFLWSGQGLKALAGFGAAPRITKAFPYKKCLKNVPSYILPKPRFFNANTLNFRKIIFRFCVLYKNYYPHL